MDQRNHKPYDYVLIGAGLQSGLLIMALRHYQPHRRVLVLEASDRVGGNHTWCGHDLDFPSDCLWLEPLICHHWAAYQVRFSGLERTVNRPYRCITSPHFEQVIRELTSDETADDMPGGVTLCTRTVVSQITDQSATTEGGETYFGRVVIDCRGPNRTGSHGTAVACGYQKFVGWEISLQEDWPDQVPVMMDARIEQRDGFRFCYVLPFTPRRILVEDTYFSENPELDRQSSYEVIRDYVRRRTTGRWTVLREEAGCLPMPMGSSNLPSVLNPLAGGYAGGWFHAATGYSLPLAIRFADAVANVPPEKAHEAVAALAASHRTRAAYARFLNRMLFRLVRPETRWQIFQRFFRVLSDDALCRFFAHEFTTTDAARIILGWPPTGLTPIRFLQPPKHTCPVPSAC